MHQPARDRIPDSYTIHIGAPLGPEWAEWLDASEIRARDDHNGLITAAVRDQAMLHGLLERIRDLAVPLIGLYPAWDTPETQAPPQSGHTESGCPRPHSLQERTEP